MPTQAQTLVDFQTYRLAEVQEKLRRGQFSPLDVMITGVTGAGKSTTLNAIFRREVAKVGHGTDPETMANQFYLLSEGGIRFWDTPGLGDGIEADARHERKIRDLLQRPYSADWPHFGYIDLVLVIVDVGLRDLGTTYHLINRVIRPHIDAGRILVALNQADMALKGKHWDAHRRQPEAELVTALRDKGRSIQRRILDSTGISVTPVCYSAEHGYGLDHLMDMIIENIPDGRRRLTAH